MFNSFDVGAALHIGPFSSFFNDYLRQKSVNRRNAAWINVGDIFNGESSYWELVGGCTQIDVTIN